MRPPESAPGRTELGDWALTAIFVVLGLLALAMGSGDKFDPGPPGDVPFGDMP